MPYLPGGAASPTGLADGECQSGDILADLRAMEDKLRGIRAPASDNRVRQSILAKRSQRKEMIADRNRRISEAKRAKGKRDG